MEVDSEILAGVWSSKDDKIATSIQCYIHEHSNMTLEKCDLDVENADMQNVSSNNVQHKCKKS